MLGRGSFLVFLLAAAIGGPYLSTMALTGSKPAGDDTAESELSAIALPAAASDPPLVLPELGPANRMKPKADLAPVVPMEDALRFDVSLAWILSRWSRVSAGLAELDLQGYRVPWISGTAEDDVAGSLTYYFNKEKHLQKITFRGTTGDARKLVTLLSQRYDFLRQVNPDPSLHLYQARWNGKARSQLEVRAARIVRSDDPHARFQVTMFLTNPDLR